MSRRQEWINEQYVKEKSCSTSIPPILVRRDGRTGRKFLATNKLKQGERGIGINKVGVVENKTNIKEILAVCGRSAPIAGGKL